MSSAPHALDADWLGACRTAAAALGRLLDERPTTRERVEETGTRGEGGDRTLVIDQRAEDAVFAELDKLTRAACASRRSPRSAARSTTATPACGWSSTRSTARSTPSAGCPRT